MNRRCAILPCLVLSAAGSQPAAAGEDFDILKARQSLFHDAIDRVVPYVVRIETIGGAQPRVAGQTAPPEREEDDGSPPPERTPFQDVLGSKFMVADGPTAGIIYDADGWILTSSFNFVREHAHITVHLTDGRDFVADLVARDRVRKLALLKIDATGLDTPQWVPFSEIRVGMRTIALGRGFGGETPSVTIGIVSALNRMAGNALQTDAKLSPANYGGPLIDLRGRVLGICVPMAQRPGELAGVEFYDAGIGFALTSERVREIVAELKEGVAFYRGWLGVSINTRTKNNCTIRAVADPSPVRDLGILPGDIIAQANGHELRGIQNLRQAIYMSPAGEVVQLIIRRDDLEYGYEVVLARNIELGALIENEPPPIDPANPFTVPKKLPWKR